MFFFQIWMHIHRGVIYYYMYVEYDIHVYNNIVTY